MSARTFMQKCNKKVNILDKREGAFYNHFAHNPAANFSILSLRGLQGLLQCVLIAICSMNSFKDLNLSLEDFGPGIQ
jgi:hypothetical protein